MNIFIINASAQQATTAAGGDATGSGGSTAFSVGQVVYTTNTSNSGTITQGVQQPYEIFLITGIDDKNISLQLSVYPNPTENIMTLEISDFSDKQWSYKLHDVGGKIIAENSIRSNKTEINITHLSAAVYFLSVFQKENEIKTFRISKN